MGQPGIFHRMSSLDEYIVQRSYTVGSETSQYHEEKKSIRDCVSSGERKRKSPNRGACTLGLRDRDMGQEGG